MKYKMIKDLLFPPRCVICDEVVPIGEMICGNCRRYIKPIEEPRCMRCGKKIEDETEEYCLDCSRKNRGYIKGYPCFDYVSPVSNSVLRMKYHDRPEYASFYGKEIALLFGNEFKSMKIEALIPVPLHKNRLRKRGYNQAELIAVSLSREVGIPVRDDILYRESETVAQKKLSNEEREKNLSNAFVAREIKNVPQRVVIVDDIYTTGATIGASAKALRSIGIKEIYYTSICIGNVV